MMNVSVPLNCSDAVKCPKYKQYVLTPETIFEIKYFFYQHFVIIYFLISSLCFFHVHCDI